MCIYLTCVKLSCDTYKLKKNYFYRLLFLIHFMLSTV